MGKMREKYFLLILQSISLFSSVSSYRSFGDSCSAYAGLNDPNQGCDPRKNLLCSRVTNRCECYDNMGFSYGFDRCTFRVGFPCTDNYSGGSAYQQGQGGLGFLGGGFAGCPPNSYCDSLSRICQCEPYYRPSYDNSYCAASSRIFSSFAVVLFSIIITSLKVFI